MIVSRGRVVALPSNLFRCSKSWRFACVLLCLVLCLCCACVGVCFACLRSYLMACSLVVVIVGMVDDGVVTVVMVVLVGDVVVIIVLGVIVVLGVVALPRVQVLVLLK